MYKYFPHTIDDTKKMLEVIGVESIDDLFNEIPKELLFKKEYNILSSMSELEVTKHLENLSDKNKQLTVFMGAGSYDVYTPSIIKHLISRQEFLTAYTPYQPEISQGTLQYIFEFQSMITNLTGLDAANASMYDGPTATAEAMFMACNARKRNKILVSKTINPNIIEVLKTYSKYRFIEIEYIEQTDGITDINSIKDKMSSDYAGLIVQNPNFYGIVENYSEVSDIVHENKGLLIMNVDPSTLSVIKTPGEYKADIACGDAQTLGIPLSFGGPYVGFLSTTKKLLRKMPGRICGITEDVDGKRAFVLTLQAREQHIRREKANSNICSNQSLMALYTTVYLSTMGKEGLKEVATRSMQGAHYLYDELIKTNKFKAVYDKPFFKEFVLETDLDVEKINKALLDNNILGGLHLEKFDKSLKGQIMFCVTEKRTKEEIDKLVNILEMI